MTFLSYLLVLKPGSLLSFYCLVREKPGLLIMLQTKLLFF